MSVRDVNEYGRVAVMLGGDSAEREVSLNSGGQVCESLLRSGVDAFTFDPAKRDLVELRAERVERVFLILHGRGGEDGVMQGALEVMGIPYTGSGVLGSALGMDKLLSKRIWQAAGLPTPRYRAVGADVDCDRLLADLGLPLMVKPAHEGSSIGMSRVGDAKDLQKSLDEALGFDHEVIVEQWIDGPEYTAALLAGTVLPMIRLETPREFYDYEAKYALDTTRYHCPCGLPAGREAQLAKLCAEAFALIRASGWGRVDFMLDGEGSAWLLEVNTAPGMTDHSLVPMAARASGIDFDELCLRILDTSFGSSDVRREAP